MDPEKHTSSYKGGLLMNDVVEIDPGKEAPPNDSCIDGLNDVGKLAAFMVCFVSGLTIQLFAFDTSRHDFIFWFLIGNAAMFLGIGFFAKISYQIANLGSRKRKEFGGAYFLAVIAIVLWESFVHEGLLLVVLCFLVELIAYFQYSRTYVEVFDNYAKRFFGGFGYYE